MALKLDRETFTSTLALERSHYGNLVPTISLTARNGTSCRRIKAALHALAMMAEIGTSPRDSWSVNLELASDRAGRVFIELGHGTASEARRAMELLEDALSVAFI